MSRRNAAGGKATTTGAVFGELLKHLRESAGLTQEGLAKRIPCDRSLVARIEAGTRVPQDTFADTCDIVLKTGGTLLHLWARIDWYPEVQHPDWFQRRADMDAKAVSLHVFGTQVIPGLLQTEEYARALFSRVAAANDEDSVEERVRARLSRQQRFLSQGGPLLIAVLDESVVRNVVGGDAVMYSQCAHLLEVGQRPNVRIQIAPAHRSGLVRPNTSMSLITLPDGHDWVYSESLDRGHFNDDPAVFAKHAQTYDVLRADAPSVRESAALLSEAMEGYGHHGQARSQRGDMGQEQLQRRQWRRLRRGGPRYPRRRPCT